MTDMTEITFNSYWAEVRNIADQLVIEAMGQTEDDSEAAEEMINDTLLHETIDGHQWIIYYHYNLQVIQRSDNQDAMLDNHGAECLGDIIKEKGLSGLHATMAYCALEADVQEKLFSAMESYNERNDTGEES